MAKSTNKPLQEQLACVVACGRTVRASAKALEIPERTAFRWTGTPEFKAMERRAREQIRDRCVRLQASALLKASRALAKQIKPDVDLETLLRIVRGLNADQAVAGGTAGPSGAPGIIVPGLDTRWQGAAGEGGEP